ncbi:hypothetical protein AB0300_18595 [Microbacterium sp. NPDC078814]|uniref:hypothetical protein n=1 Tax=Microbacterium sp. NPDC078814 TaxID=3154767 RepID=UPI00344C06A1
MSKKQTCRRCGETVETIDNILGYSFWGIVQKKVETTVRRSVRVASTTIRHDDRNAMRCDEEDPLCDPCWGLLVSFLQGREVVAVKHEHQWKPMHKHPLDRCGLCYRTRITQTDSTIRGRDDS